MKFENYLINEGINDKGIFKTMFMAGFPGAGKSYTISKIKAGEIDPRIVNTDKLFPLFKDIWNTQWQKIASRVKTTTKKQLALYVNSMLPMFIDGTSANTSSLLRRSGLLESYGYDTGMVFINTSLETSIERASKRERKVDPEFIKEAYEKVLKAKSFYRSKFSTWIEVNNDVGELTDKVILNAFKFTRGFFNSDIINPVGIDYKETMLKNGWKYLSPNIVNLDDIQRAVEVWYKKD